MKRLWAALCALVLMASMSAFAQDSNGQMATADKKVAKAEKKEMKAAEKGKDMRLTGWVKDDGGKVTFVNDKDKQSWDVSNADVLKDHVGHHVKVKAKLDESNHSLTVDSVKMMRKGKQAGAKKG